MELSFLKEHEKMFELQKFQIIGFYWSLLRDFHVAWKFVLLIESWKWG